MITSPVVFDVAIAIVVLLGVAVVARPVVADVLRRRRHQVVATVAPPSPDGAAAWTVDRALKALAAEAAREGIVLPRIVTATVDGAGVRLRLATPTVQPPVPWTATDDGLDWSASHHELQAVPLGVNTPNPYPGLVTLGVTPDGRILVDLDRARGIIAVQGERVDRQAAATDIVHEITTNPWSREAPLLLVGLDEYDAPGATAGATIDEVLEAVATTSRGVALLRDAPVGQRGADLIEILADEECTWCVLVVGTAPYARWRFTAEPDGRLTSDAFPDAVRATPREPAAA